MYYSQILQYMSRQSADTPKPLELLCKVDLDRRANTEPIRIEQICEDIDYLRMYGLIRSTSHPSTDLLQRRYTLTVKWYEELSDLDRANLSEPEFNLDVRPELCDPLPIDRYSQTPYEWEANSWYSFEFAVLRTVEPDEEVDVAIVSGFLRRDSRSIKPAIEKALSEWYQTELGGKAWLDSMQDFNIGDLDPSQRELREALRRNGIVDLKIGHCRASRHWQYDDILGTPPPEDRPIQNAEIPVGSLRISWSHAASQEIFYQPVVDLATASSTLEALARYDSFLLGGYVSPGGSVQRYIAYETIAGTEEKIWVDCTDEITPF